LIIGALVEDLQRSEESKLRRFFQRRFRNREDAADATQETFLRMLSISPLTLIENPQAYLFQVARSVAHSATARLMADRALFDRETDGLNVAEDAPGAERVVDARQRLIMLAKAIEELPPRCQQVFILSRIAGMANGDIAKKLGISRNMVEKHIIRALLHCRRVRGKIS
jgi:RNA polymerase sigma factor (sigma-70 family)